MSPFGQTFPFSAFENSSENAYDTATSGPPSQIGQASGRRSPQYFAARNRSGCASQMSKREICPEWYSRKMARRARE